MRDGDNSFKSLNSVALSAVSTSTYVNSIHTSQVCPNCQTQTGKKLLSERVHVCSNCGYVTDRDVAAAQVVCQRGLAAVGYTVKMLGEGKFIGIPATQESPDFLFKCAQAKFKQSGECQKLDITSRAAFKVCSISSSV